MILKRGGKVIFHIAFEKIQKEPARRNDPTAITIVTSGVDGTKTYATLSGGQADKVYIVTAKVTTTDGLVDRRAFRVNVKNRQA